MVISELSEDVEWYRLARTRRLRYNDLRLCLRQDGWPLVRLCHSSSRMSNGKNRTTLESHTSYIDSLSHKKGEKRRKWNMGDCVCVFSDGRQQKLSFHKNIQIELITVIIIWLGNVIDGSLSRLRERGAKKHQVYLRLEYGLPWEVDRSRGVSTYLYTKDKKQGREGKHMSWRGM